MTARQRVTENILDVDEIGELVLNFLSNPEKILTADLNQDKIQEIKRRINPYNFIPNIDEDTGEESVICSITNFREKFLDRVSMVSLAGFLFRMAKEAKLPETSRRFCFREFEEEKAPFTVEELLKKTDQIKRLADDTERIRIDLENAKNDYQFVKSEESAKELLNDGSEHKSSLDLDTLVKKEELPRPRNPYHKNSKQLEEDISNLTKRLAVLRYLTTAHMYAIGQDASSRFESTAREMSEVDPEVKETINLSEVKRTYISSDRIEIPDKVCSTLIKRFLNMWLEYNPDDHVRPSFDTKNIKPTTEQIISGLAEPIEVQEINREALGLNSIKLRTPLTTNEKDKNVVQKVLSCEKYYNNTMRILREIHFSKKLQNLLAGKDTEMRTAIVNLNLIEVKMKYSFIRDEEDLSAFKFFLNNEHSGDIDIDYVLTSRELFIYLLKPVYEHLASRTAIDYITPNDIFHRWTYYRTVNYESILNIVETLYSEHRDVESAICIYKHLHGTGEEMDKKFAEFRERYGESVITDVLCVPMKQWVALAPYSKNRDVTDFLNSRTEIINKMLERIKSDQKFGAELLKKRVKKDKAESIKKSGPDDPKLGDYRAFNTATAELGVERALTDRDIKILEMSGGSAKKEKEIEIINSQLKRLFNLEAAVSRFKLENKEVPTELTSEVINIRKQMRELIAMLEVPDNAIKVDVFVNDTVNEKFVRETLFTKADDNAVIET